MTVCVPAGRKRIRLMVEGNEAGQDILEGEGRGVLQFILELIRSGVTALRTIITSVVDTGRNLVSALIEWVLGAITSLVSSVAQRVITNIATEV